MSLGRGYCKNVEMSIVNILLNNRSDLLIKLIPGYTNMPNLIYNMLTGISSGQHTWKVVLPHLSVRVSEVFGDNNVYLTHAFFV